MSNFISDKNLVTPCQRQNVARCVKTITLFYHKHPSARHLESTLFVFFIRKVSDFFIVTVIPPISNSDDEVSDDKKQ